MSNLSKHLTLYDTGKLSYTLPPISSMQVSSTWDNNPQRYAKNYEIKAAIVARMVIAEGEDLSQAVRQARLMLVEEMFGEFRENFCELKGIMLNSYNRDAMDALIKFEAKMFNVE